MMKLINLIVIGFLMVFFLPSVSLATSGTGFVGANIGLDYLTGDDSDSALLYGGTVKYFFGDKIGIGINYNLAEHNDVDFKYLIGDLMFRVGDENNITYFAASYGKVDLDFSAFGMDLETDFNVWGVGVGGFTVRENPGFGIGWDIKYLHPTDGGGDGIVQAYISFGYSF